MSLDSCIETLLLFPQTIKDFVLQARKTLKPSECDYTDEMKAETIDYQIQCLFIDAILRIKWIYETFIPGTAAYSKFQANPVLITLNNMPKTFKRGMCFDYMEDDFQTNPKVFVEDELKLWNTIAKTFKEIEPMFNLKPRKSENILTKVTTIYSPLIDLYTSIFEIITGTLQYKPFGDKDFPFVDLEKMEATMDDDIHEGEFCESPFQNEEEAQKYEELTWQYDETFDRDKVVEWLKII